MIASIKTITIPFMFNTSVNCYLLRAGDGFVLIDTGVAKKRAFIEQELGSAGCRPGNLNLIILTHGDFDHSGNAAYLRDKYDTKVAMHREDAGCVERGDMFWNRKQPNFIIKMLTRLVSRLDESDRFAPDVHLEDGMSLSEYGLDAEVISITGHSKGSIAILTGEGDLFCGDLLGNASEPRLWSLMDDLEAAGASIEKLKGLAVRTVYPGHGKPFSAEQLKQVAVG